MRKILGKLFNNPFYVYAFVWLIALLFYFLRWSDTFPDLSIDLIGFILITIIAAVLLGNKLKTPHFEIKNDETLVWKISLILISLTTLLFIITFLVKGIPIVEVLFSNRLFDYSEYRGIQFITISAFAINTISLSLFLTAYLLSRKKRYLLLLFLAVLPLILFFNRLYAMTSFLPFIFTWGMLSKDRIIKYIVRATFLITFASFLFGIVGNYREEAKKRQNNVSFYDDYLGEKYPAFLPKDFFWGYFYLTSPIGKLQYVTDDDQYKDKENDLRELFLLEVLPNAIGYRINDLIKGEVRKSDFGYPTYFAGTAYRNVFLYGKWFGVGVYTIIFFGFIFLLFNYFLRLNSLLRPVLIGTLCTIMALSVFSNTLILTVFYLIFAFGILLSFILNKFSKNILISE